MKILLTLLLMTMIQPNLNGTWIPIKQEMGGQELPPAAFAGQQLVLKDSSYTVFAEHIDKGSVTYNSNKLEIISLEGANAGKHIKAISKLENGLLTVCYDLSGKDYPKEFSTKGQPLYFLAVFKREQP